MSAAPELLTECAAERLRTLLAQGCDTRAAAPALLAIDALVSYACQALAFAGGDISERAEAMALALSTTLAAPDAAA